MTKPATRFIVFVQSLDETSRINEVYGVFQSYAKAIKQCQRLQELNPDMWVGIRELLKPTKACL